MATSINYPLTLNVKQAYRSIDGVYNHAQRLFGKKGIKLDVKIGAPLGRITNDLSQFNRSLEASNARVLAFGASTGVIYSLQKAFRSMITDTVQVEKQLKNINVILQASDKVFKKFGSDLFQVASNTGQAFSAAADAAGEFARQGLSISKTLQATQAALILTRQTGLEASKSVEALTAAVNTFDREGLTHIDIVNKMASVDAAFAVSSADLAEGLKRVGSSAVDAGLSLDQLNAAIAATQQISARGGAIIGNSFKTIFARLQTSDVQQALNDIGIATKDANGEFINAIEILQTLSNTLASLPAQQRADIIEDVAGKRQINTLRALLSGLRGEYSLFQKALDASANSADAAVLRNEELNETIDAMAVKTSNLITEFNSAAGKITFAPVIRELLGGTNSILESLITSLEKDPALEDLGDVFVKGLFKGIGNAIQGPGLAVFVGIITKIITLLSKDLLQGLSSLRLGEIKGKEQLINFYNQLSRVDKERIASATSLEARQKLLNNLIREQIALRKQEQSFVNQALLTLPRGLRGQAQATGKGFANGYIPSMSTEGAMVAAGVGGAPASAQPTVASVDLGNGKKNVIVNTSEYIVDRFGGGKASAIFNQNMVKSVGGLNNLKSFGNIRKAYAKGFVPNMASPVGDAIAREISALAGLGYSPEQAAASVKVGQSPFLKSKSNPNGLGVYNTIQGQYSVGRAIGDHSGEGSNLAGSVPSMVDLTSLLRNTGNFGNASSAALEKFVKAAEKLEKATKNSTEREKIRTKIISAQENLQDRRASVSKLSSDEILKRLRSRSQSGLPDRDTSLLGRELSVRRAASRAGSAESDEVKKLAREQAKRNAQLKAEEKLLREIEKKKIGSGLLGLFRNTGKQVDSIAGRLGVDPRSAALNDIKKELKAQQSARFGTAALTAGFALPIAGGLISQSLFKDQESKGAKATNEAFTAAGTGLSLAFFSGPLGAVVGGIGLLGAAATALREDFEALSKASSQAIEARRTELQFAEQFVTANNQLQSLVNDPNASRTAIIRATRDRSQAFSNITDRSLRNDFLKAISDPTEDSNVKLAEIIQQQSFQNNQLEQANKVRDLIKKQLSDEEGRLGAIARFFDPNGVKSNITNTLSSQEIAAVVSTVSRSADLGKLTADQIKLLESTRTGESGLSFGELTREIKSVFSDDVAAVFDQIGKDFESRVSGNGRSITAAIARDLLSRREENSILSSDADILFNKSVTDFKKTIADLSSSINVLSGFEDTLKSINLSKFLNTLNNDVRLGSGSEIDAINFRFIDSITNSIGNALKQSSALSQSSFSQFLGLADDINTSGGQATFLRSLLDSGGGSDFSSLIETLKNIEGENGTLSTKALAIQQNNLAEQIKLRELFASSVEIEKQNLAVNLELAARAERSKQFSGREFEDFDAQNSEILKSIFGSRDQQRENEGRLRNARGQGSVRFEQELEDQLSARLIKNREFLKGFEERRDRGDLPRDEEERRALFNRVSRTRKEINLERERSFIGQAAGQTSQQLEEILGPSFARNFDATIQKALQSFSTNILNGDILGAELSLSELRFQTESLNKNKLTNKFLPSQNEAGNVLNSFLQAIGLSDTRLDSVGKASREDTEKDFKDPNEKLNLAADKLSAAADKLSQFSTNVEEIRKSFTTTLESQIQELNKKDTSSKFNENISQITNTISEKKGQLSKAEEESSLLKELRTSLNNVANVFVTAFADDQNALSRFNARFSAAKQELDNPNRSVESVNKAFEDLNKLVAAFTIASSFELPPEQKKLLKTTIADASGFTNVNQIPKDTSLSSISKLKEEIATLEQQRTAIQQTRDKVLEGISKNIENINAGESLNKLSKEIGNVGESIASALRESGLSDLATQIKGAADSFASSKVEIQNTIDHNLKLDIAFKDLNLTELSDVLTEPVKQLLKKVLKEYSAANNLNNPAIPSLNVERE